MTVQINKLNSEKSLWSLYLTSFKFPNNKFNLLTGIFVAVLLSIYAFTSYSTQSELSFLIRETVKLGLGLAPSVLGFLIAGFTVFVTVTKIEVFVRMAQVPYEETGESYLKYNLSAFMLAFAHYVAYIAVCVLFTFFLQPNGPLQGLIKYFVGSISGNPVLSYKLVTGAALVVFGTWTWHLIMLLKSFIYNTYQVVITTVRWEMNVRVNSTDSV